VSPPRWQGDDDDTVARELTGALDEARARLPDDVTMRRMWARVANVEAPDIESSELSGLSVDGEPSPDVIMPVADVVRLRATRPLRWIWFAGGVGSTAALTIAVVAWLWPRHPATPTVALRPTATPAVETRIVPAPEGAAEGTIRTGAGEQLQLTLMGGAEARLESSTVMTVDHAGRAKVDGGEVAFRVPHQAPGHSYVVLAGPYRVVVLGTRFKLRLDDARRVVIDAQEGVVEIWDHARLASLAPGETWVSPALPGLATPPAADAPPAHTHPHPRATVAEATNADDVEAVAKAALVAGDATRALALYRGLAQHGGPAAENAAYEVGKILRDRLGQPANAISAWRRYRAEHPNGVLRVEADVSIIETLVHTGDTTDALAEANDFVRNHPESERRAEIARVAGDLYRARGDFKRAAAAYEIALASPLVRDAAEPATFHRAECLMRLGDPSGAEATRAYLRRWPSGRFRTEAERLLESGDGVGAARL
jgi:FecR protein/Tetratricopeptide repeat